MSLNLFTKWTHLPPVNFEKWLNDYRTIIQLWSAIRQRRWALGSYLWPRTGNPWGQNIVGSLQDNGDGTFTLTDGTPFKDFYAIFNPDPSATYVPDDFDIIISFNDLDPSMQVRAHATGHTDAVFAVGVEPPTISEPATFTIDDYSDYVTARCIASIQPPSGAKYFLIPHNGLWWGDKDSDLMRWPDWPNAFEEDYGATIQAIEDDEETVRTDRVILDSAFDFVPADDQWANRQTGPFDLLLYDSDNKLRRVNITANRLATEKDTSTSEDIGKPVVLFNGGDWEPKDDDSYTIVKADGIAFPGRTEFLSHPWWWYSGLLTHYFIHAPQDYDEPLTSQIIITDIYSVSDGEDIGNCPDCDLGECDKDALYQDVWTSSQNVCGPADAPFSPRIYKSLGMLQAEVEAICASFIPPLDYPTSNRSPKQPFTIAILFQFCGINSGTSSVIDKASSHYHATVDSKYNGLTVYYTILKGSHWNAKDRGIERDSGTATVTDGQIDLGTALYNAADELANPGNDNIKNDVGETVYWSAGWTRHSPKMFRTMYARTGFIPDTDSGVAVFPPPSEAALEATFGDDGCFGVGQYIKREASTNLMEFDEHGVAGDGPAFTVGDLATYMGESWAYPIVPETPGDGNDGTLKFYDRFTETRHPDADQDHLGATQEELVADAAGTITSCTAYSLTDSSKDWWAYWYDGGELRVETGTATGGSATSITDSTKAVGEGAPNCWWQASRFSGFSSSWVDFILEIDHTVNGVLKHYKLPITDSDPDTATVNFESIGVDFSQGTVVYRIREPDTTLNRYQNKLCVITRSDGTHFGAVVQQSDRDTLYFNPADLPTPLQIGWAYEIQEFYPGGTYKWTGTEWVKPTGNDSRKASVKFRPQPEENAPDQVTGYGKLRKFDYVSEDVFKELRTAINALRWTPITIDMASRQVAGTIEYNRRNSDWEGDAATILIAQTQYNDGTAPDNPFEHDETLIGVGGMFPFAYGFGDAQQGTYSFQRAFGYPHATAIPILMKSALAAFIFTQKLPHNPVLDVERFEFSANGDNVQENAWTKISEQAPMQTAERRGEISGDGGLTIPDDPPEWFVTDPEFTQTFRGYYTVDRIGILKWDVSGGMTFLP